MLPLTSCRINGCSLKTAENLDTAKSVHLKRLMFETGGHYININQSATNLKCLDAPWCSMTTTQASRAHILTLPPSLNSLYFPPATKPESFVHGKPVKGRNEPMAIGGVAWVVHKLHEGTSFEEVTETAWRNTVELFGLEELNISA
jgi:TatD DNase family protein